MLVPDRADARARRRHDHLTTIERLDVTADQRQRVLLITGVHVHLAAARLAFRELHLMAEPLQQRHSRPPDVRYSVSARHVTNRAIRMSFIMFLRFPAWKSPGGQQAPRGVTHGRNVAQVGHRLDGCPVGPSTSWSAPPMTGPPCLPGRLGKIIMILNGTWLVPPACPFAQLPGACPAASPQPGDPASPSLPSPVPDPQSGLSSRMAARHAAGCHRRRARLV